MNSKHRNAAVLALLILGALGAPAAADVCVSIDAPHDTLSTSERTAALLLLSREFELAGERVASEGCTSPYLLSHIQLGTTIAVTLSGPRGSRQATAIGLDDLPAVYSQMVRSLLADRPMDSVGIIDRTNVSNTQAAEANRVQSDSVWYARLGYGGFFGGGAHGGASATLLGYRKELNRFAIDVSFLGFQYSASDAAYAYGYAYDRGSSAFGGTWLKLEALRFVSPQSDRSAFVGGGLSWTGTNIDDHDTTWHGSGLQGELTAGYEIGRASTVRLFVQLDAGLPFYSVTGYTYSYSYSSAPRTYAAPTVTVRHRYMPSAAVSLGFGWQRGKR